MIVMSLISCFRLHHKLHHESPGPGESSGPGAQTQHPRHHQDTVEDGAVEGVQQGSDGEDDEQQHLQSRSHLWLRVGEEDECVASVQRPGVLVIRQSVIHSVRTVSTVIIREIYSSREIYKQVHTSTLTLHFRLSKQSVSSVSVLHCHNNLAVFL